MKKRNQLICIFLFLTSLGYANTMESIPTKSYPQHASVDLKNNALNISGGFKAVIGGVQVIGKDVKKFPHNDDVTITGEIYIYSDAAGGTVMVANKAVINTVTDEMFVYSLKGYANQIFFTADSGTFTKTKFTLKNSQISTDRNLVIPGNKAQYAVGGKTIAMRPGESVEGIDLTFYTGGTPLFGFPWYAGSLEPEGPNLFPLPGSSGYYGNYVLWGGYYDVLGSLGRGYLNFRWSEKRGWYLDQWKNYYAFSDDNYGSIWVKDVLLLPKGGVKRDTWDVLWEHHLSLDDNPKAVLRKGTWDLFFENMALASLTDSEGDSVVFSPDTQQGSYFKYVVSGSQAIGKNGLLTVDISEADANLTRTIINQGVSSSVAGTPSGSLWAKIHYAQENSDYAWTTDYDKELILFPSANAGTGYSFKNNWSSYYAFKHSKLGLGYTHINQDIWGSVSYNPNISLITYPRYDKFSYTMDAGAYDIGGGWQTSASVSRHHDDIEKNDWYAVQNWLGLAPRAVYEDSGDYTQTTASVSNDQQDLGFLGRLSLDSSISKKSYLGGQILTTQNVSGTLETPILEIDKDHSNFKLSNIAPFEFEKNYGQRPFITPTTQAVLPGVSTELATQSVFDSQMYGEGFRTQFFDWDTKNVFSVKRQSDYLSNQEATVTKRYDLTVNKGVTSTSAYIEDMHANDPLNLALKQSYNRHAGVSYSNPLIQGTLNYDFENNQDFNTQNLSSAPNSAQYDSVISHNISYTNPIFGVGYKPVELWVNNTDYSGQLAKGFIDNYTVAWSNDSLLVNRYLKATYSHVRSFSYDASKFYPITGLQTPQDSMSLQFNITDTRDFYHYWKQEQLKNIQAVVPDAKSKFSVQDSGIPDDVAYVTSGYTKKVSTTNSSSGSAVIDDSSLKNSSGSSILDNNYTAYNLENLGNSDKNYFYNSIIQYGLGVSLAYDNLYWKNNHDFEQSITDAGVKLTFKKGDLLYLTPEYHLTRTRAGTSPLTSNFGGELIAKVYGEDDFGWWAGVNYSKNYYNYQNPVITDNSMTSKTLGFTVSHRVKALQFSIGYEMDWDQFNHVYNHQINLSIWTVAFPSALMSLTPTF